MPATAAPAASAWLPAERWVAGLLVFFYLSGILAHLWPAVRPLALASTDLFLLLMNGALLWLLYRRHGDDRLLVWAAIAYLGTFAVEAMGVATGAIFGEYTYGATMRVQWLGVPLVIAFNWVVLMLATNDLAQRLLPQSWPARALTVSVLAAVCIAVYDYFIEPVAIALDYWQWGDGTIPLRNYLAWGVVALVFSLPLNALGIRFRSPVLLVYLAVQWVFFVALNALL